MLCTIFNPESNEYFTGKHSKTGAWSIYLNKARLFFKLEDARKRRASLGRQNPELKLKIRIYDLNMIKEV